MAGYSTSSAQPSKPLVPAWLLSVVIHGAMFIALCVAVKPFPHGAADGQYGSMGLVLHRTSTCDALGADGRPFVQQTVAMMDEPAPPLLLASTVVETNEPATTKEETPTQPPKSASGISTS